MPRKKEAITPELQPLQMSPVENTPDRTRATMKSGSVPFPIKPKEQNKDGHDSPDPLPALPPHMESFRSHTTDEIVQMMKRVPLFMTSLEEAEADDDGENIELEAIRALKYEGTRAETALGLKESGNEMVKAKRWKEAKDFYTQALRTLHEDQATDSGKDVKENSDPEAEMQKEKEVEEACYVNRALCNLSLKNYRATTIDCASALCLNPMNEKAYYRSALALNALSKFREALDACQRGYCLFLSTGPFITLLEEIKSRSAAATAIEEARAVKGSRAKQENQILKAALLARGIALRDTPNPPSLEDAVMHLSPDPLSPSSALVFPVLLLYPLHAQSDFIKAFPESDHFAQHLSYIFPLPWDTEKEYTLGNVELYAETGRDGGGLLKVGKKVPLLEWAWGGKIVVVDGVIKVNVLIKGKASGWIKEVKQRLGK